MNKKLVSWGMISLMTISSFAQKYTLTGQAPDGAKYVYLQNLQSREADSVLVKDGRFIFSGEADGKMFARLSAGEKAQVSVVLEGDVTIDLATLTVTGTKENELLNTWERKLAPYMADIETVEKEYFAFKQSGQKMTNEIANAFDAKEEAAWQKAVPLITECCKENVSYKFPAIFLRPAHYYMSKTEIIALAENGNPAYLQTSYMERLRNAIPGWKNQLPGVQFTDLTMADTEGTMHNLSEYVGKGRYVLIDFWASWCGPCRRSMPALKQLYATWKDKNFDIVGLSLDEDKAAWQGTIKRIDLPWHHLSDLKGWASIAAQTYGINSIPATLLVAPDGKVIASGLDATAVDTKLKELIKE